MLMATHIVNRLPSVILHWKTPYEILYKREPDYMSLKFFGCLGYATNTLPHKRKFEDKAHRCVFIGYVPGQKAFKLYNLDTEQVMVSRDVIFYEDIFPFKDITHQEKGNNPVPLPIITGNPPNSEVITAGNDVGNEGVGEPELNNDTTSSEEDNEQIPRQGARQRRAHAWLGDYVVNTSIQNTKNPKTTYKINTYPYTKFLANVSLISEPYTYEQAKGSVEWQQAMHHELKALE